MNRGTLILVAFALLTVSLAGCLGEDRTGEDPGTPPGQDGDDGAAFVPPEPEEDLNDRIDPFHPDHQNPMSHTESYGLSVKGYHSLADLVPATSQYGWTEVDVHGHLVALATYYGDGGVALVDISDPAQPEPLSFIGSHGRDYDARISDDGRYLFFGCQSPSAPSPMGLAGDCTGSAIETVGEASGERTTGLVAYDITDPSEPVLAGFLPGVSTHNIWTHAIGGTHYVFTDGVEIVRFDPSGDVSSSLEQVAEVPGGHDAFVHEHPVTGQTILYTTAGNSFAVFDVSDPSNPNVLVEQGPDVTGWHKQAASTEVVDGRVLLVVGGEVATDEGGTLDGSQPPMISVLNVTDPSAPETLSQWTLPVSDLPPWVNYRFSPHNIALSPHGQVYVAWNHAGSWVFDVSTQERQEAPVTLGFYQPHETPPACAPTVNPTGDTAVPRVWGGTFDHHGYIVVADMYTGLYVLEPEWGLYDA